MMAVLEDPERPLVVPIVNDMLQDVRVPAARHFLEKVPAHDVAAFTQSMFGDRFPGALGGLRLIEDDAP